MLIGINVVHNKCSIGLDSNHVASSMPGWETFGDVLPPCGQNGIQHFRARWRIFFYKVKILLSQKVKNTITVCAETKGVIFKLVQMSDSGEVLQMCCYAEAAGRSRSLVKRTGVRVSQGLRAIVSVYSSGVST